VPGQVVRHWMGIDLRKGRVLLVVEVEASDFVVIGFGHVRTLGDSKYDDESPARYPQRTAGTQRHSTPTAAAALIKDLSKVASGSPVTMAARRYVAS